MGLLDRFHREPRSRVHMILSVDEYPAGESFDIPVHEADRWILRGYATGTLSREYSDQERSELNAGHQTVGI